MDKEPVYIRSDFLNKYVELTKEQIQRLIQFVEELEKEELDGLERD